MLTPLAGADSKALCGHLCTETVQCFVLYTARQMARSHGEWLHCAQTTCSLAATYCVLVKLTLTQPVYEFPTFLWKPNAGYNTSTVTLS
jgi:hypothetical protein